MSDIQTGGATHQTNMWDDDVEWNGVIFPVNLATIKDFKGSNVAIRNPKNYQDVEAGEVSFDI